MGKNKNEDKDIDISKYQSLSGLSNKKLDFGLWFANNKKKFFIAIVVILILLSAGFFLYSGYHYAYYLLEGKEYDQKLAEELSQYDESNLNYRLNNPLEGLKISNVQSFSSDGSYDLLSSIKNPNGRYFANFIYCFTADDEELICGRDFIFPLEEKYLLALAIEDDKARDAKLRISNISWSRVNLHKYPDWSNYYSEHLNFETSDIQFKPARKSILSEKMSLDTLEFNIKNKTPYNYWEVPLNIVLYNGNRAVGVYKYIVNEFRSGEERSIRLVWPGNISQADKVEIRPNINIVDPDIYIKY